MSKTLSAKHYQKNKERLQKEAWKRYQNLSIKEKEKIDDMATNVTKICQKIKSKILLSIGKHILQQEKTLYYNWKKSILI